MVIKCIFATETLAAGVDLPNVSVVYVLTLSYGDNESSGQMRVDGITQMVGRGGETAVDATCTSTSGWQRRRSCWIYG
jgi:replicative superfamily II helicase